MLLTWLPLLCRLMVLSTELLVLNPAGLLFWPCSRGSAVSAGFPCGDADTDAVSSAGLPLSHSHPVTSSSSAAQHCPDPLSPARWPGNAEGARGSDTGLVTAVTVLQAGSSSCCSAFTQGARPSSF